MTAEDKLSGEPFRRRRGIGRDVAVVGAGAVGLTVALELARLAATVTVYEAGTVAGGSSGRAAGVCYDAFAAEPDATLGREAIEGFRSFAEAGAPFTSCPYAWVAREGDDRRAARVRDGIRRMQDLGIAVDELDGAELAERFPHLRTDDVAVAGVTSDAGYTDTAAYTAWLAEHAREAGVTIETETPVALDVDAPAVVPGGGAGEPVEVDDVVVAAGPHSKRLLAGAGVPIAMKPYRVQALVARGVADGRDDTAARFREPMVYDASADWYVRPHEEGLLAGDGTERREADPDSYDREANPGFAADLAARVTHRLPGRDLDVERAWAGLCTATPDRDPLVGEVRERVYVATGFQGQGFMRSPAIGRRLADDVLGGDGIPAFDPRRFDGDESFEIRAGMAIEPES